MRYSTLDMFIAFVCYYIAECSGRCVDCLGRLLLWEVSFVRGKIKTEFNASCYVEKYAEILGSTLRMPVILVLCPPTRRRLCDQLVCLSFCLCGKRAGMSTNDLLFLSRDAMHKRGLCRHAVSVCPCVCLPRSWVASKRIKISSTFYHRRVATPF